MVYLPSTAYETDLFGTLYLLYLNLYLLYMNQEFKNIFTPGSIVSFRSDRKTGGYIVRATR